MFFSIPPTANLAARTNLFLMTTSHTPTIPQTHTHTLRDSHQSVCLFCRSGSIFGVKACLHKWSVGHMWASHTLHADPNHTVRCTRTNVSLTDTVNHAQIPSERFFFFFSRIYDVFKGVNRNTVRAFWHRIVIHPGACGLQSHPLWARSHDQQEPRSRTSKRCTSIRGICVSGNTRFFSAGARAMLSVWWKEAASPWSLASSLPIFCWILPNSPSFTLHPSSLFPLPLKTSCSQNAATCHYPSRARWVSSTIACSLFCSITLRAI